MIFRELDKKFCTHFFEFLFLAIGLGFPAQAQRLLSGPGKLDSLSNKISIVWGPLRIAASSREIKSVNFNGNEMYSISYDTSLTREQFLKAIESPIQTQCPNRFSGRMTSIAYYNQSKSINLTFAQDLQNASTPMLSEEAKKDLDNQLKSGDKLTFVYAVDGPDQISVHGMINIKIKDSKFGDANFVHHNYCYDPEENYWQMVTGFSSMTIIRVDTTTEKGKRIKSAFKDPKKNYIYHVPGFTTRCRMRECEQDLLYANAQITGIVKDPNVVDPWSLTELTPPSLKDATFLYPGAYIFKYVDPIKMRQDSGVWVIQGSPMLQDQFHPITYQNGEISYTLYQADIIELKDKRTAVPIQRRMINSKFIQSVMNPASLKRVLALENIIVMDAQGKMYYLPQPLILIQEELQSKK